ncbi:hypothetical protein CEXT_134161 [Caerostris extrusa]|uniref:Secreted protein n=1 Tax=Caerostris extrusa TaxID=172846 RepID=A0AAV4VH63_CAEEX|nr:hypothetical protein CEXT_134161 [Caerostris extrusa]
MGVAFFFATILSPTEGKVIEISVCRRRCGICKIRACALKELLVNSPLNGPIVWPLQGFNNAPPIPFPPAGCRVCWMNGGSNEVDVER